MERFVFIGVLIFVTVASCTHQGNNFLLPADNQDAEYAMLIDSMEAVFDDFKYHDFTDSIVSPALATVAFRCFSCGCHIDAVQAQETHGIARSRGAAAVERGLATT